MHFSESVGCDLHALDKRFSGSVLTVSGHYEFFVRLLLFDKDIGMLC